MLAAVGGYYNGKEIVMDEQINLIEGQRVIITILEHAPSKKEKIDLSRYMGRGRKMFPEGADDYVKGLRADDRI